MVYKVWVIIMGAWVLWDALIGVFKVLPWMLLIVVIFTVVCLILMTIVIGGTFLLVRIGGVISDLREKLKSPEQKKRDKRALAKLIKKEKESHIYTANDAKRDKLQAKLEKQREREDRKQQLTELEIMGNWGILSKKEREDFDNRTLAAFESGYSAGLADYRKGRPCKRLKGDDSYEDGYMHGYYWS